MSARHEADILTELKLHCEREAEVCNVITAQNALLTLLCVNERGAGQVLLTSAFV